MACPARFERATYALEAVKMSRNNKLDNSISLARSGVRSAPKTLVRGGITRKLGSIGRQLDGLVCKFVGLTDNIKRENDLT
jgi:hypothetical protein